MSNREGWGEPVNVAGVEFFEIEKIEVMEFHELPDGQGDPSEVHLMLKIAEWPHPFIIRFHSRRPVDELIVALMTHSKAVWP